jgi:hypothetical protein
MSSEQTFPLELKSTLDYLVHGVATSLGYAYLDLDAASLEAELAQSKTPVVAWALTSLEPSPIDPMWMAQLEIGVKLVDDPSQYKSMAAVGEISRVFSLGGRISIKDYSLVAMPSVATGGLVPFSMSVLPQQSEQSFSIRMLSIRLAAVRTF